MVTKWFHSRSSAPLWNERMSSRKCPSAFWIDTNLQRSFCLTLLSRKKTKPITVNILYTHKTTYLLSFFLSSRFSCQYLGCPVCTTIQNIVLEYFPGVSILCFGGGGDFLIGSFLINTNGRKESSSFHMLLNIVLSSRGNEMYRLQVKITENF